LDWFKSEMSLEDHSILSQLWQFFIFFSVRCRLQFTLTVLLILGPRKSNILLFLCHY